jgi:NitT/TauT family transport system permease protein
MVATLEHSLETPRSHHGWASVDVRRHLEWLAVPLGVVTLVAVWAVLAAWIGRPYVLPPPAAVLGSLVIHRDRIAWHTEATLTAVLLGFLTGFVMATVLGYVISRSVTLERLLAPYLVSSQAVPVVAIAPLLVYWLGSSGLAVKVVTAALIVFFPVLINTVVGLRGIDPGERELMRLLSASRWQTLWLLELPAALPVLLAGVRVGVTLAVIGAVVGEFLGSDRGLGTLIQIASSQFNDALMFAALLTLAVMALTLYGAAAATERLLLRDRTAPPPTRPRS